MGMEEFFNYIKSRCASEEEYVYEVIMARGFLLEENSFVLSDNSHKDDGAYLNELLKENNIGRLEGRKILISSFSNIERIFDVNNYRNVTASSITESWGEFAQKQYTPKVLLRILEPFVARYIKAVSACGVLTWCSCDGNPPVSHGSRIAVDISEPSSRAWHRLLCEKYFKEGIKLNWNEEYSRIAFNKRTQWNTYIELNRAAEYLYKNRKKFREIKNKSFTGISSNQLKKLSKDEVEEFFRKAAGTLLDEYKISE